MKTKNFTEGFAGFLILGIAIIAILKWGFDEYVRSLSYGWVDVKVERESK